MLFKFNKILAEAVMLCIICPTATSAAVITGKLGGSAASVSTYTLLINVLVAFVVPVFFPLVEAHPEITFFQSSAKILSRVFLLLICPFIVACLLRQFAPKVHRAMLSVPNLAFYLWGVALAIVTSQIFSSLLENTTELSLVVLIAVFTCAICSFQFFLGKTIGSKYDDRVSGGQSLGQKNTILAIWMAHTYLNPIAALGPGFYVAWQNIINSWQLWKKRRKDSAK